MYVAADVLVHNTNGLLDIVSVFKFSGGFCSDIFLLIHNITGECIYSMRRNTCVYVYT